MPDEDDKTKNSQDNDSEDNSNEDDSGNESGDDSGDELKLEDVVEVEKDDLTDDQKTFLEENKTDLTPEQAEKFDIKVEKKDDEPIDPDDVEVETDGKKAEKDDKKTKKKDDDDSDDDAGEVDPDDKAAISKVVQKELEPVKEGLASIKKLENETKVTNFIATNPEFAKYQGVILKYKNHPDYVNVPVGHIATIVAGKDLQKMGAEKERIATKKAKDTQGSGDPARKTPGGKVDWSKASTEEVAAQKAKILERQGD